MFGEKFFQDFFSFILLLTYLIFAMKPDFYTFQEIIRYNANDWNQAYEVLQFYLKNGSFKKEIRGPEDIIYHNLGRVEPFNLVY